MAINVAKLHMELVTAGIPIDGVSIDGRIDYKVNATPAQITQGNAILAAHDGLQLGLVDCGTSGAKLIGLVGSNDGKTAFLPGRYTVFCRARSGTAPTVSMGTNSPSYNNIQPATPLTAFTVGKFQQFFISTLFDAVLAPTPIYINVTVAATGFILGAIFQGDYYQYA